MKNKCLFQVVKQTSDFHFWVGLMDVKDLFLEKREIQSNSGNQIRFWEDYWIGQEPLKSKYPALYNIVRRKGAAVASVQVAPSECFF